MCGKVEGLGRSMAEIYTELNSMVDVVEVIREGAGGLAYYQRRGRRQSSRPLPLQWERGTKITYRARTGEISLLPFFFCCLGKKEKLFPDPPLRDFVMCMTFLNHFFLHP